MQLHEALGRLDKLPLHENTTVSAVELGKFIDDAVSNLRANPDDGSTWYKYLDGSLGIAIGWEDGYDTESGYEIAAKICNLDSDFMKDYNFLTMPYDESTGEVWDTTISNPSSADASWFIKQLNAISDAVDKGELVTEGVNVTKHSSRRRSLTERGLTKAERHNRAMEKISNNYKAQQEKYKKFLASKGVSEEDIDELDRNSGLHGNALGAKAHKMASADEWNKLHESKKVKSDKRIKEDLDTIDPGDIYDVVIKELDSKDIAHHASDLYVRKTPESTKIINRLSKKSLLSTFKDNIDGDIWYDLPFCYTPYFNESLKSKKRKISESINKINRILRRLNEAPMSDEDREDTKKLRALASKISNMDGRQAPRKYYTQDDLDIAQKYGLTLPQGRADNKKIIDNDTKRSVNGYIAKDWYNNKRNVADGVRKNKERSIEDIGNGQKARRYLDNYWTQSSPLEQDRERDAEKMSRTVRHMQGALDNRRHAQNRLSSLDAEYDARVKKAFDNAQAIKDAGETRDYFRDIYSDSQQRAQSEIDDILANAKKRNKTESLKESFSVVDISNGERFGKFEDSESAIRKALQYVNLGLVDKAVAVVDDNYNIIKAFDRRGRQIDIRESFKRNHSKRLKESEDGVSKWVLVDYYDVWGNADDGWEVNNLSREDEITISDDASDKEIFEYLRDTVKYFNKSLKFEDVAVMSDSDLIEFEASADGMPICRLERIG